LSKGYRKYGLCGRHEERLRSLEHFTLSNLPQALCRVGASALLTKVSPSREAFGTASDLGLCTFAKEHLLSYDSLLFERGVFIVVRNFLTPANFSVDLHAAVWKGAFALLVAHSDLCVSVSVCVCVSRSCDLYRCVPMHVVRWRS
jgi:hypothetical protein